MIPINISSQSPVSKENISGTTEVTGHDYTGQNPGCVVNSIQWETLESIYLEIKVIKIRHYSQQPCG